MITEEKAAQVCWAARREMFHLHGHPAPVWKRLEPWQREWMINMIRQVRLGTSCSDIHKGWCEVSAQNGWIYGDKRAQRRRHNPLMKPWEELEYWGQCVYRLQQSMVIGMTLDLLD